MYIKNVIASNANTQQMLRILNNKCDELNNKCDDYAKQIEQIKRQKNGIHQTNDTHLLQMQDVNNNNNHEAKISELEQKLAVSLKRILMEEITQKASKLHLNKEKEDIMMEFDNKLCSKLEALTIKMQQMEGKNEEFVKLTAINRLRMDELEKEIKRLKEEKKEIHRKYKEIHSKNDESIKTTASNTSRMEETDRKYTELHTKNDGLNEKYNELKGQYDELILIQNKYKDDINELTDNLQELKGIKMKELEEEIKAFKNTEQCQSMQLKQLLDDNKMDELEKEIKGLKEEKKEIHRKYKELQSKNDELNKSKMQEIDRKYTELHDKNDGLDEKYNGLKRQYDELMLIQNKYKDDIKELTDNLQELKGTKMKELEQIKAFKEKEICKNGQLKQSLDDTKMDDIIYNKEKTVTDHDDEDKQINDIICNKEETKINCNDEENKMNDNIYNKEETKINDDEVDRERVIDDIESVSNKEEEGIKLNADQEINLDGIKSTLIWNEKDAKWKKICKKSTIKMYQNNDGMDEWMVSVKDIKSDQVKFNHVIPNKDAANFKCVEDKMSCQWMAKNDSIQKEYDTFTIFIKFESKQAFKTFIDLFEKISIERK